LIAGALCPRGYIIPVYYSIGSCPGIVVSDGGKGGRVDILFTVKPGIDIGGYIGTSSRKFKVGVCDGSSRWDVDIKKTTATTFPFIIS
jgi:hypothetical protein